MYLISIDPGVQQSAWALFLRTTIDGPILQDVGFSSYSDPPPVRADRVVCEGQYVARGQPHKANDVVNLAFEAGLLSASWAERADHVYRIPPVCWKGTVPKHIHNARTLSRLSPYERELVDVYPKSKRHNIIDAVGLGLWAFDNLDQLARYCVVKGQP